MKADTGQEKWRHTDEVTAGDGRVVGSATGNADFGVVGPLVEEVVRAAVGMGIGASEEGRSHNCGGLHVLGVKAQRNREVLYSGINGFFG